MSDYKIEFVRSASKELDQLPKKVSAKVMAALEKLRFNPRPHRSKKLVGEDNHYRIRIGDYRVIYEIFEKTVTVLIIRIRHRKDVYR